MEALKLKHRMPLATMEEVQFLESRELRSVLNLVPELKILLQPETLRAKENRIRNDRNYREKLAGIYRILANVLKDSSTLEEFVKQLSDLKKQVHQVYNQNLEKVAEQTLEIRRNLFSLKGFFENYNGKKARIIPVNRNQFVEAADDSYWQRMTNLIMKDYKAWDMRKTPCYLTCTFPLETAAGARKVAAFMESVMGTAQLDIPVFSNSDTVIDFMDESFKIVGPNGELAHIMFSGTHAFMNGVCEDFQGKVKMAIPIGPMLTAKMMDVQPGEYFVSLSGSPIKGIDGVSCEYQFARDDASEFAERGLIQILGNGAVMGVSTCCNGDIMEYNTFTNMDIFIMVQRALIHMANQIVPGPFGDEEEEIFKNVLIKYFSRLYDNTNGTRVIDKSVAKEQIEIFHDKEKQSVFVSIPIKYKGVVSQFTFTLKGDQNGFDGIKKTK